MFRVLGMYNIAVEIENLLLLNGPFMTRLPDKKCQTNNFGKNRPVGYISLFCYSFLGQFLKLILEKQICFKYL